MEHADALVAPELAGLALTLALSLLIGFEREELRATRQGTFFGGVRTFPLVGLTGYLLALSFPDSQLPFAAGLLIVGVLLAVSHHASVARESTGLTTEAAALLTFGLGGAAAAGVYWAAVACGVVAVLLLHEKQRLEELVTRVPREEVGTLVRFLLLTGVILPVVPNQPFTRFAINPFAVWLVVVAVSGISYASYLVQRRLDRRRGLMLSGVLGGAYSSTVTTVVLARLSRREDHAPAAVAGAILAASGMMYLRIWVLLALFSPPLARLLTVVFWGVGLAAVLVGLALTHATARSADRTEDARPATRAGNPLEMTAALAFAVVFITVMIVTEVVAERFGGTGLLLLAGVMGAADVDPFILGLAQRGATAMPVETAALAVLVATAANNLMKGVYAVAFGRRRAGGYALALLVAAGAASLAVFLLR